MNNVDPDPQQENKPPGTNQSSSMKPVDLDTPPLTSISDVDGARAAETPKPLHRRVAGLKLRANAQPSSSDGLRRFALRANMAASDPKGKGKATRSPGFVSKELPKLHISDHISEWRGFELGKPTYPHAKVSAGLTPAAERTPEAMLDLELTAIPYQTWDDFLTQIYEAIADGPDGPMCEDRYLIFSKVTREIMHGTIDPARRDGTVPKAARFTHFVPSNLLIVKIPVDCHSSAGFLDFIVKPVIGWSHAVGMARELKLCGNTRYVAKVPESAGADLDVHSEHPALRKIAASNPAVMDGFGSFNECDAAFRPLRARPYKFDAPSVVVEGSFGSDFSTLRYKACWWLQLLRGEVKAVILINIDPSAQEVVIELWRNHRPAPGADPQGSGGDGGDVVPTRVQRLVVSKKDEFKGCKEQGDAHHYRVEGAPLTVTFTDFFLEEVETGADGLPENRWDFFIFEHELAQEAADLWFGDGELVNDWVEAAVGGEAEGASRGEAGGESRGEPSGA